MGIVTQHSECDPRRETPGTRSQRDRSGTDPAPASVAEFLSGNRGVRIGVVKLLRARGDA